MKVIAQKVPKSAEIITGNVFLVLNHPILVPLIMWARYTTEKQAFTEKFYWFYFSYKYIVSKAEKSRQEVDSNTNMYLPS